MKVMLFGATGRVGRTLLPKLLAQGWAVVPLGHEDIAIEEEPHVRRLLQAFHPDWVINAAAYTDVAGAQKAEDLAMATNAEGAQNIAKACALTGAKLLHLSTDFVFDGKKRSPYQVSDRVATLTNPSVYGMSKAMGEELVRFSGVSGVILRAGWLHGVGEDFFVKLFTKALDADAPNPFFVVDDEVGVPTSVDALTDWLMAYLKPNPKPTDLSVVHYREAGPQVSRFALAKRAFELGADATSYPVVRDAFERALKHLKASQDEAGFRPKYTALEATVGEGWPAFSDWDAGVRESVSAHVKRLG